VLTGFIPLKAYLLNTVGSNLVQTYSALVTLNFLYYSVMVYDKRYLYM